MGTRTLVRLLSLLAILAVPAAASWAAAQSTVEPPPNTPATVEWNAAEGRLSLRYHGTVILDATIRAEDAGGHEVRGVAVKLEPAETLGEKVEQRLKFTPSEPREGMELVLRGTVTGSEEAFPAETESNAQKRFPLVHNSVGLSRNLRNNAVYDRRWDWVLVGPADGATRIQPKQAGKQAIAFAWESRGPTIELTFRPRFYQKHKEIKYFTPWTYKVWEGSLTGYCTWWSYRERFSQETLDALVKVFVDKRLPDFGYRYMQFDNCYQIGNGSHPDNWLTWNKGKYPLGWQHAMKTIRDAGMDPGIWVHRVHRPNDPHVKQVGEEHPDWFVHTNDGKILQHSGFYALNTHNKDAVDAMIRPLYRGLKEQGWDYVKIDGAGDLLSAYNRKDVTQFFEKVGSTPAETWRKWDEVARQELGPEVFILTCWGVGPGVNSVGLSDACRLGSDGFGTGEFQHFNSWNGVVWRNDPDHCDILGEYYMDNDAMMPVFATKAPVPARSVIRPALCTMAGGMLMVSDKVEVYQDDLNLEGMKRSAPVLFTVPGQLYDYAQRGNKDYGAPLNGGEATWWMLEIDRPFDHWSVLARFQWGKKQGEKHVWQYQGVPQEKVAFADLGLPDDREYLVFEFWTQTFLGKFKGSFTALAMDENTALHVFVIREARAHPWIISTTRHISQGGVDLLDVKWDSGSKTLSGRSSVVIGDPYVMTVHLPEGFRLTGAEVGGEKVEIANQKETATIRIVPSATKTVEWKMAFAGHD